MATLLIDITRLGEYDVLIKKHINKTFKGLSDKIGVVPAKIGEGDDEEVVNDVIDYIQKSIALANKENIALAARVTANETAVQTTLPAYIDAAAAAAIAKVVSNASTDFDTLQEFEAWIKSDIDGAAAMQKAIKVLQGTDGSAQTKDSASIVGVKLYIDSLVEGKNVDAAVAEGELLLTASASNNKVTIGSTSKLQTAVERAENAVQSVSKASEGTLVKVVMNNSTKNIGMGINDADLNTKIESMYAEMQGDTTETVASVEAKVDDLEVCSAQDITNLFEGLDLD